MVSIKKGAGLHKVGGACWEGKRGVFIPEIWMMFFCFGFGEKKYHRKREREWKNAIFCLKLTEKYKWKCEKKWKRIEKELWPNIGLISLRLFHILEIGDCFRLRFSSNLSEYLLKCRLNVTSHVSSVSTDVDVSSVVDRLPDTVTCLPETVLHVDLEKNDFLKEISQFFAVF